MALPDGDLPTQRAHEGECTVCCGLVHRQRRADHDHIVPVVPLISYGTLLLFGLNSFVIQFAILILIYPETAGRILEQDGHILPACR